MKKVKYKGKEITINDFYQIIPFSQLEPIMGKANNKRFMEWMNGQTVCSDGVYPCDLERWLEGGSSFRF